MKGDSEISPASLAVVGAAFVATIVNGFVIANSAITIFMAPIAADYGWSHAEIGSAATALFLGLGLGSPVLGPIVDRHGSRAVILPLAVASGILLAAISFVGKSLPLFYAAHFLLGTFTPGAVAYAKLISKWFFRRRGIALTALGAGTFFGSVIIPLIARFLLERVGWQTTYLFFAAGEFLVALPILFFFFRERPGATDPRGIAGNEIAPDGAPKIGIGQALSSRNYWCVVAVQITGYLAYLGLSTHAVGIMGERGVDAATAALGVSIFAIGGFAAQLATGILLDRFDTPRVIAPFAALSAASMILLYLGRGPWVILPVMLLAGFGCAGQTSMTSYFTTRYFGVRNFSTIIGSIMPILLLFSAPSPVIVGAIFDRTHSYELAIMLFEGSLILSIILFFRLDPYPYPVRASVPDRTVSS